MTSAQQMFVTYYAVKSPVKKMTLASPVCESVHKFMNFVRITIHMRQLLVMI